MQNYDWQSHYAPQMMEGEKASAFRHYEIENKTGKGEIISCTVFPGVQAIYNDLFLLRCAKPVSQAQDIIEISYCHEGRYECEVNSRYCFYIGHGDLTIGTAGRKEAGGGFPTRRYCGLTLFLDLLAMEKHCAMILREMEINLDAIRKLAVQGPRRFVLHGSAEIDTIFRSMIPAETEHSLPMLRLRIQELFMLLSDSSLAEQSNAPVYLSRKHVLLAKDVYQRVTEDLSRHLTLETLSAELHAAPTAIKTAFKSVYGESLRDYLKSCRLQEAQRLLRETDKPVAEIATAVGYANPGHFSAAFREKFGMTPGEYKRTVRFER